MLKALLLLLMNLALAVMATAQNLVPNPSFEDTARCGEYDLVRLQMPPWFNPNIATPDVYDNNLTAPCGLPWDPSNPDVQDQGYQQARTGTRFAGAFHWYGPEATDTKEYLMVKLLSPLSQGSWYEVGLFVSRPEGFVYATDRIGVHFSADSIHEDISSTLPLDPQVELFAPNGGYLTDAVDWVELRDTFQATGVERYMVIGSFQDSSEVNGIELPPANVLWQYAYYYYDDVFVREVVSASMPELAGCGSDAAGISLCWNGPGLLERVRVLDLAGRLVADHRVTVEPGGWVSIPLSQAMPGTYVVIGSSREKRSATKVYWTAGVR